MFVLVDGIYPQYKRFVKGYKEPVSPIEKVFTGWQEGARKDIERAFGHLQQRFQWIARPIQLHQLTDIANRVANCVILHNMCVSDRVMDGDTNATYNPTTQILEVVAPTDVDMPSNLADVQGIGDKVTIDTLSIGLSAAPTEVQQLINRKREWKSLQDLVEHSRLHTALMTHHYAAHILEKHEVHYINWLFI